MEQTRQSIYPEVGPTKMTPKKETNVLESYNGWKVKKLGEVAEYFNGRAFKPKEWGKKGLPIIRIQNLTKSTDKVNYYDGKYEEKHFVENGDILLAWSATLDVFEWNEGHALLNQHIFNVKVNGSVVHKRYFLYYIKNILEKIKGRTHGTGMTHITKPMLLSMDILVPPLETQKKIVARLDAFFEHYNKIREEKQKAKEKHEKILKAAIAKLIPQDILLEGWQEKAIGELIAIKYGKGLKRNERRDGSVFVYGSNGVIGAHNQALVQHETIIIGRKGSVGTVHLSKGPSWPIDTTYFVEVKAGVNLDLEFFYYLLYNINLVGLDTSTAIPGIRRDDIYRTKIKVPSGIKEQKDILVRIKMIAKSKLLIKELQRSMDGQLEQLPKAVLNKAFRGELI